MKEWGKTDTKTLGYNLSAEVLMVSQWLNSPHRSWQWVREHHTPVTNLSPPDFLRIHLENRVYGNRKLCWERSQPIWPIGDNFLPSGKGNLSTWIEMTKKDRPGTTSRWSIMKQNNLSPCFISRSLTPRISGLEWAWDTNRFLIGSAPSLSLSQETRTAIVTVALWHM